MSLRAAALLVAWLSLAACEDPGASAVRDTRPVVAPDTRDTRVSPPADTLTTAPICEDGSCAGPICTPHTRICGGFTTVLACTDLGDAWVEVQSCASGAACADGVCLSPCDVNIKDGSYLGCEYWAVDLDNIEEATDAPVGVVVSVPARGRSTEVTITSAVTGERLDAATLGVADLFVDPGEVKVFRLPRGYDIDGTSLTKRSFKLVTTTPVTVHQFNPLNGAGVYSNDASLLLPSQVTGGDYIVMAWPHRRDGVTLRAFVTVIATQPGTTRVHVTASAGIAAGEGVLALRAGDTRLFELTEGDVLNLETDGSDGGDLTGTLITSDRQASVIAGHECANVPSGVSKCDHIEQQLIPVDTWGVRYVADTFFARSGSQVDIFRIMGGGTDVTVTTQPPVPGYESFVLQRGTWVQLAASEPFTLSSDGPILVGHFLTGSGYPGADKVCADELGAATGLGDPAFTLGVPTNRFLRQYAVLTPSGYREDYLNVIAPIGAAIELDGAPVSAPLVEVGETGWGVARVRVQPGVHEVTGDRDFGLTAYGYDCDVSYAYPGGLKLQTFQEF